MSLDWECKSDRLVCRLDFHNELKYCLALKSYSDYLRLELSTFKCFFFLFDKSFS